MRGVHLPGVRLHIGDEFLEIVGGKVFPGRDDDRQSGDHADRLEIDLRPVGEVRIKRHRGSVRAHLPELDGVAVGAGAHGSDRAGGAAGAGDILDDELLPERAREVLGNDAANNVARSAGSERNDDRDRPVRIGFRPAGARETPGAGQRPEPDEEICGGQTSSRVRWRCPSA